MFFFDLLQSTAVLPDAWTGSVSPYPAILVLLLASWLLTAGLLPFSLSALAGDESCGVKPVRTLLSLGLIVLAGLLLRLLYFKATPLLSTYNGMQHTFSAFAVHHGDWSVRFPLNYPLAVPALAGATMKLFGRSFQTFTWVVTLTSLLVIPGLAMAAAALWRERRTIWLAALLGAVFPPFLLFSGTACLTLVYSAMAALALGALLLWWRTGRLVLLFQGLAALFPALQARPEAAALILPCLGALLLIRPHRDARSPLQLRWMLLFLAAILPYAVLVLFQHGVQEPGSHAPHLHRPLLVLQAGLLLATPPGLAAVADRRYGLRLLPWVIPAMQVLVLVLLLRSWGWQSFLWGPESGPGCGGALTYTRVPLLPLNPELTPFWLSLAALAAALGLRREGEAGPWVLLWIWLLAALGASLAKDTGELPFEGVRTALGAAPPLLLLAARGLSHLWTGLRAVGSMPLRMGLAGAMAVLVVLTSIGPLMAAGDDDFNQAREYDFLRASSVDLPDRSVVLYPDDVQGMEHSVGQVAWNEPIGQLFRMGYLLLVLQGENRRHIRPLGLADASLEGLDFDRGPVFFYYGLDCYRTGTNQPRKLCEQVLSEVHAEPVAQETFDNRMYAGDNCESIGIERPRIELTLYRSRGRKESADARPGTDQP